MEQLSPMRLGLGGAGVCASRVPDGCANLAVPVALQLRCDATLRVGADSRGCWLREKRQLLLWCPWPPLTFSLFLSFYLSLSSQIL